MAYAHCRFCKGQFNGMTTYEDHLLVYDDMEGKLRKDARGVLKRPGSSPSTIGYGGRPVCIGQRDGAPVIDPAVAKARDKAREMARKRRMVP